MALVHYVSENGGSEIINVIVKDNSFKNYKCKCHLLYNAPHCKIQKQKKK